MNSSLYFPNLPTYALEFLKRLHQVCDSGMQVHIAIFNMGGYCMHDDKTAEYIMATMREAYRELYGDKGMLKFVQEPLPPLNIYEHIYPMNHLHVAVSSRGLQRLSKVPEQVLEKGWNKDKVWIEGSNPQVTRAYAVQADNDLVEFLNCRKDELKVGGSLFMLIEGRRSWSDNQLGDDTDSNRKHPLNIYMERAWEELIDEGALTEQERFGYNIPIYFRTKEEVQMSIRRCGGFEIKTLLNLKIADQMNETPTMWVDNPLVYGKFRAHMAREAIENFTMNYFGENDKKSPKTEALFNRYISLAEADTEHRRACPAVLLKGVLSI